MDARVIRQQFLAIPRSPFLGKGGCIPLSISQFCSGYIGSYSIGAVYRWNPLSFILLGVFHQALLLSYFNFFSTETSYCVNCPSLISSWLLIIFEVVSCVTFGAFPSKFSKCCFHRCIRSSRLVAFSLSLAGLFLLLTSFTVCHAILDCLYSAGSLVLLIWFWVYPVRSFRNSLVHFVPS